MHEFETPRADLSAQDIVVMQGTRHGQTFVRSLLAGLRVGRVRAFDDGESALREMRIDPPTLVITDWEMKPQSGYWLLTNMRKAEMEPLCFVPAVILTSEISWSMFDVALESGVNAVLLKPISALTFQRRLESLAQTPPRFVEQDGSYIPETAREVLETKMRKRESRATRAYRERLRGFLDSAANDPSATDAPQPGGDAVVAPEAPDWKGWSAA